MQSLTVFLLACEGRIPRFDAALFADTGWEPKQVYAQLDIARRIGGQSGMPVLTVSGGNIRHDTLNPGARFVTMPWFVKNPDGSRGMARRQCSVICTISRWLIMALHVVIKEKPVDLRRQLMEGRASVPRVGSVIKVERIHPPFVVLDPAGVEIVDVTEYLRDLALGDGSPLTGRSYAFGLLRWFRLLWLLGVAWQKATEAEVAVLVGWLRTAPNPQRRRSAPGAGGPGAINPRTGKPMLATGYARTTINHALSSVSGFYEYHGHHGRGPVVNPVPSSPQRRRALAHMSPLEPKPVVGRARLRQRVVQRPPRAIPDRLWDELFDAMGCERDRALLEFFVSSGARAAELLGVTPEDLDWAGRRIYVVSKGTREREVIPASPQAFVRLALYFDEIGTPAPGESIWRTRRGEDRPLTYWALRRILQRANAVLGTNWTWHDARHTAATRMANSGTLTLPEVQAILRHADIQTTSRYLSVGVEELFDKLTEHYTRPKPQTHFPTGYAAADIEAVFGA
uniref:tyrosine-type recombinase/integrase n=1 Tax=Amycolatopsis sp. CA-096443 TaxID=3239919 RepID=UPI003F49643B